MVGKILFLFFILPSGDDEIRTRDPLLARQVLSQLSYTPILLSYYFIISFFLFCFPIGFSIVGLNGLEPSTSRLSGVRSNQLSYKPIQKTGNVGLEPTTYRLTAECSTN